MRLPWSSRQRSVAPIPRPRIVSIPSSFGARIAAEADLVDAGDEPAPLTDEEFAVLVRRAIDELPEQFARTLEHVPVMIGERGGAVGAYGLYHGAGIANPQVPAQIIVFRDTLLRDFGHDHALLAEQVRRVVRHELGHHLGFDESGVRKLGL